MNKKNHPHDRFFKAAFSEHRIVKDFLLEFLPAAVVSKLHFESLRITNQSFITKELSVFYSDLVYTCDFGIEQQVDIVLLFEHKSNIPTLPHLQLLRYMVEMWEGQIVAKETPKPIIPIVLYHGKKHWEYRSFWSYFPSSELELLTYFPEFSFQLIDLSRFSDGELLSIQAKQLSFVLYLMKQISQKMNPLNFLSLAIQQLDEADSSEANDNLIFSGIVYILQVSIFSKDELNKLLVPFSSVRLKLKSSLLSLDYH